MLQELSNICPENFSDFYEEKFHRINKIKFTHLLQHGALQRFVLS